MTQINAYLNFDGNCRDAMTFYKDCLGGELMLQTVEGSPIEVQCPAAIKHQILHGSLTNKALILMGSDMVGPGGLKKGNNISLSVSCSSEVEANNYFSNLADGGKVIEDLKLQFWGAMFGAVIDKFGIIWMFTYRKTKK